MGDSPRAANAGMQVPGRVSVGLPTYNRRALALRAARSALAQTCPEIEVIVSDDRSTDGTAEAMRELQKELEGQPRGRDLIVVEQPRQLGLVANFDYCLRHATGEFFLLLGDDDMLLPTALERLREPFLRTDAGEIGVTWCPCRIANADSTQFWVTEAGPARESSADMLAALFAGNRGPRLTSILLRTQDALAVGGYEAKYGDLCDIGNWSRVALLRRSVVCVPEPLVQYTNHAGSTTSRSSVAKWQEWARIVHADLLAMARSQGNAAGERRLRAARRNFISGITLTILIQTIGKPGWVRNMMRQALRSPGAMFTPYMLRRLMKDGRKVFTLRRAAKR